MLPADLGTAAGGDPLAPYDYNLPQGLIAQSPAARRVQARMMLLPRAGGPPEHQRVCRLPRILKPGDLLVLNDTRVVPARVMAFKPSGGKVEMLFLSPAQPREESGQGQVHQVLLRSHRPVKPGMSLYVQGKRQPVAQVLERGQRGKALVRLAMPALDLAESRGLVPLPPYVKRPGGPTAEDKRRYQTVYAARPGAVAAPTAGLHLSPELLKALCKRGIATTSVTLHVGYGTFAEPSPADLAAGRLHAEWVEVGRDACQAARAARSRGGRVVAVGTTSLRALQWAAGPGGVIRPRKGWCDILISEGSRVTAAQGIMTNFHLPRTTLLMLVAALAGRQRVLDAYAEAVEQKYRFYSYGDAMLIL